ncbi:voltage-gated chloride channel protein, partial [Clostridium perfringens]
MKQKSKKYLKYISRNNTFLLGKTFLKWLLIGGLIGIFIGGVIAIFLKSLEWATDYRVNHG